MYCACKVLICTWTIKLYSYMNIISTPHCVWGDRMVGVWNKDGGVQNF